MMIFAEGRSLPGGLRERHYSYAYLKGEEIEIQNFLLLALNADSYHRILIERWGDDAPPAEDKGIFFSVVDVTPSTESEIDSIAELIGRNALGSIHHGVLRAHNEVADLTKIILRSISERRPNGGRTISL